MSFRSPVGPENVNYTVCNKESIPLTHTPFFIDGQVYALVRWFTNIMLLVIKFYPWREAL